MVSNGTLFFAPVTSEVHQQAGLQRRRCRFSGFPMVMNYAVFYEYFVDKAGKEYKPPPNQLYNTARVYTPKDTAIVTPNSDTPYSFVDMDLRAEPFVVCNPEIEKARYL